MCVMNIGVWHRFEKNETATMFYLKSINFLKPKPETHNQFSCYIPKTYLRKTCLFYFPLPPPRQKLRNI